MSEFNEETLLADIAEKWGKYGAHYDMVRWLIKEVTILRDAVDKLNLVIEDEGIHPEHHRRIIREHRAQWPLLWKALDHIKNIRS